MTKETPTTGKETNVEPEVKDPKILQPIIKKLKNWLRNIGILAPAQPIQQEGRLENALPETETQPEEVETLGEMAQAVNEIYEFTSFSGIGMAAWNKNDILERLKNDKTFFTFRAGKGGYLEEKHGRWEYIEPAGEKVRIKIDIRLAYRQQMPIQISGEYVYKKMVRHALARMEEIIQALETGNELGPWKIDLVHLPVVKQEGSVDFSRIPNITNLSSEEELTRFGYPRDELQLPSRALPVHGLAPTQPPSSNSESMETMVESLIAPRIVIGIMERLKRDHFEGSGLILVDDEGHVIPTGDLARTANLLEGLEIKTFPGKRGAKIFIRGGEITEIQPYDVEPQRTTVDWGKLEDDEVITFKNKDE